MSARVRAWFGTVEVMDGELARFGRAGGALRFQLGVGMEALAQRSGHHALGFSSVESYALERCERSARWVQECRNLARRLAALPGIRAALEEGRLSFSMAQVLAKHATPADEDIWLAQAATRTVRAMRAVATAPPEDEPQTSAVDDEASCTLTVAVDREDAWLFECARMIARPVVGASMEQAIEALLGEGVTSLLAHVPRESLVLFDDTPADAAQRAWERELARWREEAEIRCEPRFHEQPKTDAAPAHAPPFDFDFDGDATHIDAQLRRIASALATRDLEMGRLAEAFWKADGWRRLGYATASQYARERLGTSLSAIKAKRSLARQASRLPRLAAAVATGKLGYEAARLVARVATPDTEEAWVTRARERTVRHLREDVNAAEMLARLGADAAPLPPDEPTMTELFAIESRVISGAAFGSEGHASAAEASDVDVDVDIAEVPEPTPDDSRPMSARLLRDFENTRLAARLRSQGRITLRFRLGKSTARYYRWLERVHHRHRPGSAAGRTFVHFLCSAFIDSWRHALASTEAYAHVYRRDRHRCTSPVCDRRDVTPHHLQFRSAGGDDSEENLTSLCVFCHLEGIHRGRLQAAPPASDIEWTLGETAHTVVRGRQKIRSFVAPS